MANKVPYADLRPESFRLLVDSVEKTIGNQSMYSYLVNKGIPEKQADSTTRYYQIIRRQDKKITSYTLHYLIHVLPNEVIATLAMEVMTESEPTEKEMYAEEVLRGYVKKYLPDEEKAYWKKYREMKRQMNLARAWQYDSFE